MNSNNYFNGTGDVDDDSIADKTAAQELKLSGRKEIKMHRL